MAEGQGFQSTEQVAKVIVKYATIDAAGPSGGYFDNGANRLVMGKAPPSPRTGACERSSGKSE